jgi:tetratricopeptide (TPR) repeat protein
MSKRMLVTIVAEIVLLAVVLLVVGVLSPWSFVSSSKQRGIPTSNLDPLAPVGGARSLDATIGELQARIRSGATGKERSQLGLAYLQKARVTGDPSYFSKSAELFDLSLAANPDEQEALIGRGLVSNAQHRFTEGLTYARRAIRANPYDTDALGVAVDSLLELGRYDDALRTLQKMIDLRPDVASFSRVSYYRELHGDLPGAIAAMRDALRSTPQFGEDAAWVRAKIGDLFFASGSLDRAEHMYRTARSVGSGLYLPDVGLGRVWAARGDLARAIARMRSVVEAYPTPANVILLHDLYTAAGMKPEALAQRRLLAAQLRLFAAQGVTPDVEVTQFYADHGLRPGWTVGLARRQYRARPSVRTADALAWALHASGRDAQAVGYIRKALRLGTRDPLIHFHAGAIFSAVKDAHAARLHLNEALSRNDQFSVLHSDKARELLSRISA